MHRESCTAEHHNDTCCIACLQEGHNLLCYADLSGLKHTKHGMLVYVSNDGDLAAHAAWQQPLPISIDDTEAKDELRRPVNEGGASEQNSRRTVWKQALRGNTSMTSRLAAASAADVGATGPVQAAANQRDPGSVTAGQPAEAAQQQEARAAAEGTAGLGDSEGEAPPSAEISAKAQAQQAGVSTDVDDIPELASPR